MRQNERLRRVWWLWGIPTAWAISALLIAAESAHSAGHGGWGDALDLARLAVVLVVAANGVAMLAERA